MFTEIRDISEQNVAEILGLHVANTQKDFIENTLQCLTEAESDKRYTPVGLYMNGTAVGFAMYGVFPHEVEKQRIWLDRYLIDETYQHQGLGKHFLQKMLHYLIEKFHYQQIYLSVYEDNKVAIQLYQKAGFVFNGELDDNGEKVMVKHMN